MSLYPHEPAVSPLLSASPAIATGSSSVERITGKPAQRAAAAAAAVTGTAASAAPPATSEEGLEEGDQAVGAAAAAAHAIAPPPPTVYKNELDCFMRMVKEEGVGSLYAGLVPQLVGIAPEKAIKLTVNEMLLTILEAYVPGARLWSLELMAGAGGGFAQVVFTNPVEIVKVRMQSSAASAGDGEASGVEGEEKGKRRQGGKTSLEVVKELGLRGLYSGATVTMARDVPSTALFFATYAAMKQMFPEATFLDGCVAAIPAAYLVTPMDVVKTRMQVRQRERWSMRLVHTRGANAVLLFC